MEPDRIAGLHREAPLTDVHVHPSLKAYLFRRNLWRHYHTGRTFNPFASRSDFAVLEAGGVGVIWNALHMPERPLFRCIPVGLAAALLLPVYWRLTRGSLMERLLEQLAALEREVARHPARAEIARRAADVPRITRDGKIAIVLTVEGAHVLEGDVANLDRLAAHGVAMLTLAHFFDNGVARHVVGIPPDNMVRKLCRFDFSWRQPTPLTELGRAIIRRMGELGMLLDVTHCSPAARALVYAEVARRRPIVASHVGVQAINPDPYNLTDDELREIAATGGLVGVIFMMHWVDPTVDDGLDAIWRTVEHVHRVTGSFDHVALGTDFDGFTDPPDDLPDASYLPRVTRYLAERGVSDADLRRILGGNARRVLETGWR
jgi:membrane dipeptidase